MKKLVALCLIALLLLSLSACGGKNPCEKGHTLKVTSTDPPTCTSDAMEHRDCTVCGTGYLVPIEGTALGHHFENGFCTACGYADTPAVVREGLLLFTLNGEGKGYTVRLDGGNATGEVVIPATCCTLPVVGIEENGFKGQVGMTSIVIPDSIITIANSAFEGCTGLTSVTFGKGVKTVGVRAFHSCTSLAEVVMGKSVDKIGAAAFGDCGRMQKMVLPFVGGDGQYYNLNPTHPQNGTVNVLGYIFGQQNYNGAQKVMMCHDLDPWGAQVVSYFYIPSSLSYVEILEGNYEIAYYYGEPVRRNYALVQGAFDGCSMIKEIVLPAMLKSGDMYVFRGCTGLQRLIAPGLTFSSYSIGGTNTSITTLDARAFDPALMPNVTDLTLRDVTGQQTFPNLVEYDKLTDLTLVFADDVKKIKLEGLSPVLDKITGLILPSASVEMEEGILSNITTLKRAALPYNRLAGLDMSHLEELTVLSDINYTVPMILFTRATVLKSLTLDARVTAFPANAFQNCTALQRVTLDGTGEGLSLDALIGRWVGIAFGGNRANPLCHGASLYFQASDDLYAGEHITLPEKLTALGTYVFDGCGNLKSITLGDRVVSIGENAFRNTATLKTVQFNGSLAQWCGISFAGEAANPINGADSLVIGGKKLTELGAGLTAAAISPYAFYGYRGLTSVSLPFGVASIGSRAFANCAALTDLSLSSTVALIGAFAFENCTSLFSVTFAEANGWARFADSSAPSGTPLSAYQLEDPARAAEALVATYPDYVFKKVG